MGSGKSRKKGKKIRIKHPEWYAFGLLIGLILYTILVIDLYLSKHVRVVRRPVRTAYNPLTVVSRSDIQTLIPDFDESVIIEPDVSGVTSDTVVIFVQSDYGNTDRRHLIRHTWGNPRYYGNLNTKRRIFVLFAIGTNGDAGGIPESAMDLELAENSDVLLLDIVDEYDSLTVKGLLTMTWIYRNLSQVDYVIKTDDDILLNVFGWLNAVEALDRHNASCVIVGFVWINPEVVRYGKYAVNRKHYQPEFFPSFCSGAGYIISRGAMAAILEASGHVPLLIRDDPYYTGILARTAGVNLLAFPSKTLIFEDHFVAGGFNSREILAVHRLSTRQWYRVWGGIRYRIQRGAWHRVRLRPVYGRERGIELLRLSETLNGSLKYECSTEEIFGDVFLT